MYAQIRNGQIINTWINKPVNVDGIGFQTDEYGVATSPDEVYAACGVFPSTYSNQPIEDGYHINTMTTAVVSGLPVCTYEITEIPLDAAKALRKSYISQQWQNALQNGSFVSTALNIRVDARRGLDQSSGAVNDDKGNVQGMIDLITAGIITEPVEWKGATETAPATKAQLEMVLIEISAYGAQIYQRKFAAHAAVDAYTTVDQVIAVTF